MGLPHICTVQERPTYEEKEWLRQLAGGNRQAFDALYHAYFDRVYSTAFYFLKSAGLAEDLTQDVFTGFWQYRERAAEIENLEAWLRTVTRNKVLSRISRLKTEQAYLKSLTTAISNGAGKNYVVPDYHNIPKLMDTMIQRLPPKQQKAFRLSREQGWSNEEIAAELGVSKATAKDYLVKAVAFLRKQLQEYAVVLLLIAEQLFVK